MTAPGESGPGQRSAAPRFMYQRKLALLGILGLAIWLPRAFALDRFVTVDEPSWLTFSGNFYHALAHGDLAHTAQIGHPGVTTTWIGTAAFLWRYPAYAQDAPGQLNWIRETNGPILRAHGHDPLDVLATGRTLLVLGLTIVLVISGHVAMRLLGVWPAALGLLLIAADPFHLALSRVLHVDALASSLMLLSLLGFLSYLHRGRRRLDLLLSAVAAGLAWLTKAPTLFLVPFVGALALVELWPRWRSDRGLRAEDVRWALGPFAAWGAIGLLVFVAAWPAMWVDPLGSLRAVAGQAIGAARSGHVEAPLFFNGAIVRGDPGLAFYPVTYLWRSTPVVLAGLGFAMLAFAAPRPRWAWPSHRRIVLALAAFSVLFTLFMSLGAKKFDRYLLPVYAPLDMVAAMGWLAAARVLIRFRPALARGGAPAMIGLALVTQFGTALPAFPYYFSYYNPLLGGTRKAAEVMMIGWGEGLDQAARYLNTMPSAEQLRVSTWFWNGPFSYFFKGRVVPGRLTSDTLADPEWRSADFCVVYINQRQRGRLPRDLLESLDALEPVMAVRLRGLEYVRVYDLRTIRWPRHPLPEPAPSAGP